MEIFVPDLQPVGGRDSHPRSFPGCHHLERVPLNVSGDGIQIMDESPVPDPGKRGEPPVAVAEAPGAGDVHALLHLEGPFHEVGGEICGGSAPLPDPVRQFPDGRVLHLGPE